MCWWSNSTTVRRPPTQAFRAGGRRQDLAVDQPRSAPADAWTQRRAISGALCNSDGLVVVSQDVPRSSNSRYAVSPPSVGTVPTVSADQALKKAGLHRNPHLYIVLIVVTNKVFRNANGPVINNRLIGSRGGARPLYPGT